MSRRSSWSVVAVAIPLVVASVGPVVAGGEAGNGPVYPDDAAHAGLRADAVAAREREERRRAEVASPAARAEREGRRSAFRGLSDGAARGVFSGEFRAFASRRVANPAGVAAGAESVRYLNDFQAQVRFADDRGLQLLEAVGLPLRVSDGEGEKAPVDLSLEARDGRVVSRAPWVEVSFPARAGGAIEFERAGVGVRPQLRPDASAAVADDRAFFANAGADTDFVVQPTPGGFESATVLRSPSSPEVERVEFDLPEGAVIDLTEAGGAAIRRADEVLVSVSPAHAVDAQGSPVPVSYRLDGDALEIVTAHRALDVAYPILVDPVYESWDRWSADALMDRVGWYWVQGTNPGFRQPQNEAYGHGLYVSAAPDPYTAGANAQWRWRVAGATSWIAQASFYGVILNYQGADSRAEAHTGLMTATGASSVIAHNATGVNYRTWDDHHAAQCCDKKYALISLYFPFAETRRKWTDAYAGGASLLLDDPGPPAVPTLTHSAAIGNWFKDATVTTTASSTDDGLGVKWLDLRGPASLHQQMPDPCYRQRLSADNPARCPTSTSHAFTYSTAGWPEGLNPLTVQATDPAGHQSAPRAFQVKIDRSAPLTNGTDVGGTLWDRRGKLLIGASHALTLSPKDTYSGIASAQVYLDKGTVDAATPWEFRMLPTCTGGNDCPTAPAAQTYTFGPGATTDGKHTFKVVVKDPLGHTAERAFDVLVDNTPLGAPLLTHAGLPSGWTKSAAPSVTASASDGGSATDYGSGVKKVELLDGQTVIDTRTFACDDTIAARCRQAESPAFKYSADSAALAMPVLSEGVRNLSVRAHDGAGRATSSQPWTVRVDRSAPLTDGTDVAGALWDRRGKLLIGLSHPLTLSPKDTHSGIASAHLYLDKSTIDATTPWEFRMLPTCAGSDCPTAPAAQTYTFHTANRTDGRKKFKLHVKDPVGHLATREWEALVDVSAPQITSTSHTGRPSGWTNSGAMSVDVAANDRGTAPAGDWGSGVQRLALLDGDSVIGEKTYTCNDTIAGRCAESAAHSFSYSASATATSAKLAEGEHTLKVQANDAAGRTTSSAPWTVKVDRSPPSLNLSGQLWDLANDHVTSGTYPLHAEATDEVAGLASLDVFVDAVRVPYAELVPSCPGCTATRDWTFDSSAYEPGEHTVEIVAKDHAGNEQRRTFAITIVTESVPGSFMDQHEYLYTGSSPAQQGVPAGTIDEERAALVRGVVTARNTGLPVAGATVSVIGHPEYGTTTSRSKGEYSMVINGGGPLRLRLSKSGYLAVDREVEALWNEIAWAPDTALVAYDDKPTQINIDDPFTPMQVARASVVGEPGAQRQATLMFPAATDAEMKMPDGTTRPFTQPLSVRATEYTVGAAGEEAMPAPLPDTSAYTYAVDFTVDEAEAAGAASVEFRNQPVISYTENFLGFPAGSAVPVGYYDRGLGAWVPDESGRVVKVLSESGGSAELDVTGSGVAASPTELAALGVTTAELQKLSQLYNAGQSLWRVAITHFTPYDYNWSIRLPDGSVNPSLAGLLPPAVDAQCTQPGSIVGCENQTLGEELPVHGTPYRLRYASERTRGAKAPSTLDIPLSGETLPKCTENGLEYSCVESIELEVSIAGRRFRRSFPAQPGQSYRYTWDGLDAYGRRMHGARIAQIRVGYSYEAIYADTRRFAQTGIPFSAGGPTPARTPEVLWSEFSRELGSVDAQSASLGGWLLDQHHAYDPATGTLYQGDGTRRSVQGVGAVVNSESRSDLGFDYLATAPNGDVYMSMYSYVFKARPDGSVAHIAGRGGITYRDGDEGKSARAVELNPRDIEVGPDGSVYIADFNNGRVRRVRPDGTIVTVAGGGWNRGDGGPAFVPDDPATSTNESSAGAAVRRPTGLAIDEDGTLYIAEAGERFMGQGPEDGVVRKVDPSGTITTVAGKLGPFTGELGDGGPATAAQLGLLVDVELGSDGTLYISDKLSRRIRAVAPSGRISTLAGKNGDQTREGDGGPAVEASLYNPRQLAMGAGDVVYVNDYGRIRSVASDGVIRNVAGDYLDPDRTRNLYEITENAPAASHPVGRGPVATAPDGTLFTISYGERRMLKISRPTGGFSEDEAAIPSQDGSVVYQFEAGRHTETIDALTGATLLSFGYDDGGRLASVTEHDADGEGNTTAVERDSAGRPTAIVSPASTGQQRTELTLTADGYLATVTNPAGEQHALGYGTEGLLTSLKTPREKTYSFEYDALGRLTRDTNPAGGFQTLTRTESAGTSEVAHETAGGRRSSYKVAARSGGGITRTMRGPDGLDKVMSAPDDGTTTVVQPDGTRTSASQLPEMVTGASTERFGMQAPGGGSFSLETPGARTMKGSSSRSVNLAAGGDIFSVTRLTDTATLNGRTSTSAFDRQAMQFTDTSAEDRISRTRIDSLGRPVHQEFGLRQASGSETCGTRCPSRLMPVSYAYDMHGRLTTQTQGPRTVSYAWDTEGNVATVTDTLDRVMSFTYDNAGRVLTQTLPDGRVVAYTYDADGNLTSVTPPSRPAHTFSHTAVGLTSAYVPPTIGAPTPTQYSYTPDNQLALVTRGNGEEIDPAYDSAGRVDTIAHPDGIVDYAYSSQTGSLSSVDVQSGQRLSFAYDGGLPTSETFAGATEGAVARTFDDSFRVTSTSVNGANSISFSYDDDSLLTQAGALSISRDPHDGLISTTGLGSVTTAMTYNAFGELDGSSASAGATELFEETYVRDNAGRVTSRTDAVTGDIYTYTYEQVAGEPSGRLTEVRKNGEIVGSYDYDANGNRTSRTPPGGATITASYDDQDRLTRYGTVEYSYNAAGDLVSKTDTAASETTAFDYDAIGSLLGVDMPNGTQIDYVVDGFGRRVAKKVDGEVTQRFLYGEAIGPVAELDAASQVVTRFVYGTRSNVPDYMVKGGTTYRILSDRLGNPQLVVKAATGEVVQELDYDEFGVIIRDTNPGFQPFGFAGGVYDRHTKLTRFGARDYEAETGRWTTKDPIGFAGGDTNLYGYVLGDPVNFVDPSGLILGIPGTPSGSELIHNVAGAFDGATFGFTDGIRGRLGWNDGLDKCSSGYLQSRMGGKFTSSVVIGMAGGAGGAIQIAARGGGAAAQAIGGGAFGGMVETSVLNGGSPSIGQLVGSGASGAAGGAVGDFLRQADSIDSAAREAMGGSAVSAGASYAAQGVPAANTCGC